MTAGPWVPPSGPSHRIALEVLLHGPLSRAELARRTDLSPGSLTRLTKPLVDAGLLVERPDADRAAGPGRPSTPLDVATTTHRFAGLAVTADRVHGVLTTLRAEPLAHASAPLTGTSPAEVAAVVGDVVGRLAAEAPGSGGPDRPGGAVTAVGVGLGGQVTDDGVVRRAPFLGWEDVPLGATLRAATGRDVVVANDVAALTAATHWFGEGRGLDRMALLTVGTGVGYGLVVHGRLVSDDDAGLGLVGHHPLDPLGPPCTAGHRGCASAMLASASLAAQASLAAGRTVGVEEALDLAQAGHPGVRRVVDDAGRALGRLVAAVANLTLAEAVVVGGDGVRLVEVARPALDEGLRADRDPLAAPVRVLVQAAGFDRWARGAAVAAIRSYVLGR